MSGNFIDSNIFIYLFDQTDTRKQQIAERIVQEGLEIGNAAISFQIVQETLNVLTTKLRRPANRDESRRFLDKVLVPLWKVMPSAGLYQKAVDLKARYSWSFYDALVFAGAIESNCARLLTEDMQHGQRIEGVVIENPFRK